MTCNNACTLSIVITPNHMHLDVIQLSFSFVRIAVVSHSKWGFTCVLFVTIAGADPGGGGGGGALGAEAPPSYLGFT